MATGNRAIFVGSKLLGLKALQALVEALQARLSGAITIDDTADSRSALREFQAYCAGISLPLSVLQKPSELAEVIRLEAPYCVFVVGWYWLINSALLNAVSGGFVGVHGSLLPQYRGNAPLVWAVLRGDKETGVSLFCFEEGMDTGDIIDQVSFPIEDDETIADVLNKAQTATIEVLGKHAAGILSGNAPRRKQDDKSATYVSLRRPEDGKIDWNRPAIEVCNFIRAQTRPYPGAFTHLPGSKLLRIWRASIFPYPYYAVPGLVSQKYKDGVVVTCGDGAVVIQEVELDRVTHPIDSVMKWGTRFS